MKSKTLPCITAISIFALLSIPGSLAAQDSQGRAHQHHHYKLVDLGTFGGPISGVKVEPTENFINHAGTVVGGEDTSFPTPEPGCYNPVNNNDCFISHAFVWSDGTLTDLGTLPEGASATQRELTTAEKSLESPKMVKLIRQRGIRNSSQSSGRTERLRIWERSEVCRVSLVQ